MRHGLRTRESKWLEEAKNAGQIMEATVAKVVSEFSNTPPSRRAFLQRATAIGAWLVAPNPTHSSAFDNTDAKAADIADDTSGFRAQRSQFILDNQTRFVDQEGFSRGGLSSLTAWSRGGKPDARLLEQATTTSGDLDFAWERYYRSILFDSDTKISVLTGQPSDDPEWRPISNSKISAACKAANKGLGRVAMLGQCVVTPGYPGWLDEVDFSVEELKPAAWALYPIGDPLFPSRYAFRLDDEKLMYPFYEKAVKSKISVLCVHKGLLPRDYETVLPDTWMHAQLDDVPKTARDWPQLKFVICHAAYKWNATWEPGHEDMMRFERESYIPWATDLALMPRKYGLTNVYADLGTTCGLAAVTNPRVYARLVGQLVNLMGQDRVIWGTDSLWIGGPQWPIEALRRLEVPQDIMKSAAWKEQLGDWNSNVKQAIFGLNGAHLYGVTPHRTAGLGDLTA